MESTALEETKIKHYCSSCQGNTNHKILFHKKVYGNSEDYQIAWKYFTLECMGCELISFRTETHDYEVAWPDDDDNWIYEITVEQYPLPLKDHQPIRDDYALPKNIRTVYKESIEALKSSCYLLAGVGFRGVIEAVCLDKKVQGRNLEIKINNLSKNRFITDKEAERLHAVRFMGNDSVHEMSVPKKEALYVVLEIIEHLLKNLYLIDRHAKSHLDIFITDFETFSELLFKKLKKFELGEEFPLAKYLGKDVRRLNGGQLELFEKKLVENIIKGETSFLKVGNIQTFGTNNTEKFQHFIKV